MDDASAVMDVEVQGKLEHALAHSDLPERAQKLEDREARAALLAVGRHPAKLRTAALSIMPETPRMALLGAGMLIYEGGDRPRWALTKLGEKTADVLAAAMPTLNEPERKRAKTELDTLLVEIDQELQTEVTDDTEEGKSGVVRPSSRGLGRARKRQG
ncbi:MAG: hypothetical protein ABSB69_02225 [Solirubrobacteraceae bacterium]